MESPWLTTLHEWDEAAEAKVLTPIDIASLLGYVRLILEAHKADREDLEKLTREKATAKQAADLHAEQLEDRLGMAAQDRRAMTGEISQLRGRLESTQRALDDAERLIRRQSVEIADLHRRTP